MCKGRCVDFGSGLTSFRTHRRSELEYRFRLKNRSEARSVFGRLEEHSITVTDVYWTAGAHVYRLVPLHPWAWKFQIGMRLTC